MPSASPQHNVKLAFITKGHGSSRTHRTSPGSGQLNCPSQEKWVSPGWWIQILVPVSPGAPLPSDLPGECILIKFLACKFSYQGRLLRKLLYKNDLKVLSIIPISICFRSKKCISNCGIGSIHRGKRRGSQRSRKPSDITITTYR